MYRRSYEFVSNEEIHSLAVTTEDPKQLVDLANVRGGNDNITVILMKVRCDTWLVRF